MKQDKQLKVLQAFASGRYRVNTELWRIESKVRGKWRWLKENNLPSGYKQVCLFAGRGKGPGVRVYLHIALYIGVHGAYADGLHIDHINRDRSDNRIQNLRAVLPVVNRLNTSESVYPADLRLIRANEIKAIRELHSSGLNQSEIARRLGLVRLSVRYVVKRIEAGLPLKYEAV